MTLQNYHGYNVPPVCQDSQFPQHHMNLTAPNRNLHHGEGMHPPRAFTEGTRPVCLRENAAPGQRKLRSNQQRFQNDQTTSQFQQQVVHIATPQGYQQPVRLASESPQKSAGFTCHPRQDIPTQSIEVVHPKLRLSESEKREMEKHGQERFGKPLYILRILQLRHCSTRMSQ